MPESMRPPGSGSRGPAPAHTAAEVTAAAIAVADRAGLAATTIRAVAAELGTAPAALYRYVPSRADLVARMADAALADARRPAPTGALVDDLVGLAATQVAVLRAHPWLIDTLPSTPPGPNALAMLDAGLGLLADVPAGGATKLEALAMITGVATLFARSPVEPPAATVTAITEAAATLPNLAAAFASPGSPATAEELLRRTVSSLATGLLGIDPTESANAL